MAYTPNIWVDREGTTRYFETVDNDGALIFTPDYTQVTEMGTPVNADNMNHIEEGIAAGSFTKYKSTTTYAKDDLVTAIVDNELKVYKSLQDNNNANALDNTNFWEEVEFAGGGGGTYAMFDPVIKDHVLTYEETKGLELQGTYVYKNAVAGSRYGYPDFYAKCLEEKSQATATSTTLGGTAITLYIHANGHTYYDIAQKSIVDTFYNSTGIAWFYGIDTANERIFLPRNDYFFQLTGDTSKVNEYVSAGLPNIEGRFVTGGYGSDNIAGAFYGSTIATSRHDGGNDANYTAHSAVLDASRSSSIYGNSNTVQPPASKKLLYICVGNTESDTSWIDVVTQVEGGVKDLEDKTNEGLSALANASNALRTTQITNCITEIPQRIKLELANGVLTLKAGSTAIVPNGSGKFDEVVVKSDVVNNLSSTVAQKAFLFYNPDSGAFNGWYAPNIYSGSGAPSSTQAGSLWYDSANNQFYWKSGSNWVTLDGYSLPLGIGTWDGSKWTAINQVFNGFGYIGSTIWVDKGVKGLIPNGRNEDGTLNNIEYTIANIAIYANIHAWSGTRTLNILVNTDNYIEGQDVSRFSTGKEVVGNITFSYSEEDNYWYYSSDSGSTWDKKAFVFLGTITETSTDKSVSNFNPKLPFRAVDYSDKPEVSGWGMPSNKYVDLTLGASGTKYTSPANGWFYCSIQSTSNGQYVSMSNESANYQIFNDAFQWNSCVAFVHARKGDKIHFDYTAAGTVYAFRFIYAQGEV